MANLHVKKGDTVVVIAGKDKGKTGKVLVAMPAENAVIVENVNIINKHQKARNAQEKGGIIKTEGKIDASNVQVICPVCKKATRIANSVVDGKKVRVCKVCGASLDKAVTIKKANKKAETKVVEATKTAKKEAKPATKKAAPKKTSTTAKTATKTTKTAVRKTADKG